ncbi:hypothetical protein BDW72DRAFT_198602 [Aspergillus terricola var. indicus]
MINSILAVVVVLRLVFAQSTPSLVALTTTSSALDGYQTYHVKVGDGQPRFQPNRLSANLGDSINFQIEHLSCALRSSHHGCASSESAPVEDEKQFVVRDTAPQIFFCDSADNNDCSSDILFTLNLPRLPSPTRQPNGTARAGTSSRIMSSSHVASSSMARTGLSTSSYSVNRPSKTSEAPAPPSSVPSQESGTTITPPATATSQYKSAAGARRVVGTNLDYALIAIFYIMNV